MVRPHAVMQIILFLPLIQEGQLSFTGKSMHRQVLNSLPGCSVIIHMRTDHSDMAEKFMKARLRPNTSTIKKCTNVAGLNRHLYKRHLGNFSLDRANLVFYIFGEREFS